MPVQKSALFRQDYKYLNGTGLHSKGDSYSDGLKKPSYYGRQEVHYVYRILQLAASLRHRALCNPAPLLSLLQAYSFLREIPSILFTSLRQ